MLASPCHFDVDFFVYLGMGIDEPAVKIALFIVIIAVVCYYVVRYFDKK